MKIKFIFLLLATFAFFCKMRGADNIKEVNGKFSYIVELDDAITVKEAKQRCIENARIEAMKSEFGQFITSDIISTIVETEDESSTSYMEMNEAMVKGDWLADTKEPKIDIKFIDNKLFFSAEVWGQVSEIKQSNTELDWTVKKEINDTKVEASEFNTGDRFFIDFKSPADGYLAIYLIGEDDETSCLLPYRKDPSGRIKIKGGKEYQFFDKNIDPSASYYKLNTSKPLEMNELVIIYSPNPFSKSNDVSKDSKHPNSLNSRDFQKWLLKCQRKDSEMVVNKKWIKIKS